MNHVEVSAIDSSLSLGQLEIVERFPSRFAIAPFKVWSEMYESR